MCSCKSSLVYDKNFKIDSRDGFYINLEGFSNDTIALNINGMDVLRNIVFTSQLMNEQYILIEEDMGELIISVPGNPKVSSNFNEQNLINVKVKIADASNEFNINLRQGRFLFFRKYLLSEKERYNTHRMDNKLKRFFSNTFNSHKTEIDSGMGYPSIVLFQFRKAPIYD